jgi:hypothetical protein
MTNPSAKQAHRDYVSGVLFYYQQNDIIPGDPNEGEWHEAHYPTPKCLGGNETILLLKEHHAVQGVLQSEEFQRCCFGPWEKDYLSDELLVIYYRWRADHSRKNMLAVHARMTPEEKRAHVRRWGRHDDIEHTQFRLKKAGEGAIRSCGKAVEIVDTKTGRAYLFRSEREAVRKLGVARRSLKKLFSQEKFIIQGYVGRRVL